MTTIGRILLLVDLLLMGLLDGVVLTHALEWPGKLLLTGPQWLAVQHHLYGGYATFGAVAELLSLAISVAMAVWLGLHRRPDAAFFAVTAVAVGAMLAIFAFGLQPINLQIAATTPSRLPSGWRQLLNRWSLYHTIAFLLGLMGFGALLVEAVRRKHPLDA